MKNVLKMFAFAGAAAAALSSCDSMTKAGLNPFEPTVAVPATVVSAGSVTYSEGMNMNRKSEKWAKVETLTQGYKQKIQIQTEDGRTFTHSLTLTSEYDGVAEGTVGTANIGTTSGVLRSFVPGS